MRHKVQISQSFLFDFSKGPLRWLCTVCSSSPSSRYTRPSTTRLPNWALDIKMHVPVKSKVYIGTLSIIIIHHHKERLRKYVAARIPGPARDCIFSFTDSRREVRLIFENLQYYGDAEAKKYTQKYGLHILSPCCSQSAMQAPAINRSRRT